MIEELTEDQKLAIITAEDLRVGITVCRYTSDGKCVGRIGNYPDDGLYEEIFVTDTEYWIRMQAISAMKKLVAEVEAEFVEEIFICKKCKAHFADKKEALKCAAQPAKPKFEIGQKCLYGKNIVIITDREIVPRIHTFIYMFEMTREDNPDSILSACGWRDESKLKPLRRNE